MVVTAEKKTTERENVHAVEKHREKKRVEKMMYVGPTIPGVAIQNVVYQTIPEELQKAAKEIPEIRNLCISVKDYAVAEKMIRTGTGYIASAFKKALAYKEERMGGN